MEDILDSTPDITVEDVAYYLSGARYPESKEDLVYVAKMASATQPILDIINLIPEGIYQDWDQLSFYIKKAIYG